MWFKAHPYGKKYFFKDEVFIHKLSCTFFSFILVCEPTGLVVQCDHSVFVDFGHIVDDVLWIHITMV